MEKYNEYKDSGVAWLGEIPENWKIRRIKDAITKIGSGVTPKGGSETYVNEGIPFIRSQNVYSDGLRLDNVSFITEEVHNKMKNSQLKPYDILINITGASIGRTCVFPELLKTANINQHIIYLRVKKKKVDYFAYYLKSSTIQEYIMNIQAGTSKEALNMSQVLNIELLFPEVQEQTQIANYLDAKTIAIDKKVTLLQQKIKHYKAYRKTLINQTVSKGLDKTVKLKDSGINWIGEIPEHWEVKRLKDLYKSSMGNTILKEDLKNNGKIPVYSATEKDKFFGYVNNARLILKSNDLVIPARGNSIGYVKIVKAKSTSTQTTIACKKKSKHNSKFVFYFLQGNKSVIFKFDDTAIPQFTVEDTNSINIVIPNDEKEQQQIADHLDVKTRAIDKIVNNIETRISTLKELRKTLINEVVTGKVKVSA